MAESGSGLGGKFWFRSVIAGKDSLNATYNENIQATHYKAAYGVPHNVAKFRASCAEHFMYLKHEQGASREGKAISQGKAYGLCWPSYGQQHQRTAAVRPRNGQDDYLEPSAIRLALK